MNIITNSDAQMLSTFIKWYLESSGYRSVANVIRVESKADIDSTLVNLAKNMNIVYYFFNNHELNDYIEEKAAENTFIVINIAFPALELNDIGKSERAFAIKRKKAVEYTLKYDDGAHPEGALRAEVVVIGVSRTAKTPLCLLLANQGYRAINIPLIPEVEIPQVLWEVDRQKIIGITMSPVLLYNIRAERMHQMGLLESVNYVHHERILHELEFADQVMKRLGCTVIDVSQRALEETAQKIISILKKRSAKK